MSFKNKVILVTGGSSGIGKAIALHFAKEGSKIAFSYKENKKGAEEVLSLIKESGGEGVAIQAELGKSEEAIKLVKETLSRFGRIDVLVNNAGRYVEGDDWSGESEIWEESLRQNFISALSVSREVIKVMQKQKSGVIVNISSRYSVSGRYDGPAYSASKAALVNMTEAQAKLMAPWGRSNAVSPGAVRAGYWLKADEKEIEQDVGEALIKRLVEVEEVAEIVAFLASDKAGMITGQNILIDGGITLRDKNS